MSLEEDLTKIGQRSGALALENIIIFLGKIQTGEPGVKQICMESVYRFIEQQAEYGNHYPSLREEIEKYREQINQGTE